MATITVARNTSERNVRAGFFRLPRRRGRRGADLPRFVVTRRPRVRARAIEDPFQDVTRAYSGPSSKSRIRMMYSFYFIVLLVFFSF